LTRKKHTKKPNFYKDVNIHYIRAAIRQATGVELTLHQVRDYLFSEGMITEAQYHKIIFEGYQGYEDGVYMTKRDVVSKNTVNIMPVDRQLANEEDYSNYKLRLGTYSEEYEEPKVYNNTRDNLIE
jgi:hypothetical protein